MKKIFILSILLLSVSCLSAQISLTNTDVMPVGSSFEVATDTLMAGGENQGSAGANQTWNLSTLATHTIDTVSIENAAGTPNAGSFPSANLVVNSGIGTAYAELNGTQFALLGLVGDPAGFGQNFVVDLIPSTVAMPFPYTYGTAWLDTTGLDITIDASGLGIPLVDSGRYKSVQYRDLVVDGWGSLKLGSGTYNSLREKEVTRTIDSIWGWNQFFGWNLIQSSDVTDSTFRWWDKTRGYTLATVDYDENGIDQISYLDPNSGVSRNPALEVYAGVKVYPNPTQSRLWLEVEDHQASLFQVMDPLGKEVATFEIFPGTHAFSVDQLPTGAYFYRILTFEKQLLGTGKLLIN